MSLLLNVDSPNVLVKTFPKNVMPALGFQYPIEIGRESLGMEDFCEMVKYVLTNTDLEKDDPRLELVELIKASKVVDGYNKPAKMLSLGKSYDNLHNLHHLGE